MKSFLDKMKENISTVSEKAVNMTNAVAETTSLKSKIAQEESLQKKLYEEIGKYYFSKYASEADEEVADMICKIKVSIDNVKEMRHQISVIKGVKVCPSCGAENLLSANFCTECGKQIPKEASPLTDDMMLCPKCGNPVNKGVRFCTSCGFNIESLKANEKKQPEAVVEPKPVVKPEAAVEPKPVVEPKAAVEPKPIVEPDVMDEPRTAEIETAAGTDMVMNTEKAEQPAIVTKDRFCKACGAKLVAGALFCTECGTKQ